MSKLLNVQGGPGTGKTTHLIGLYTKACEMAGVGPERTLAVTFTRAASDELRQRCAQALGIDGQPWVLRRRLPFVGTIHSLCLRLSGLDHDKLVNKQALVAFDSRLKDFKVPDLEEMETWAYDVPNFDAEDIEAALYLRAAALHRMIPYEDTWDLLPEELASRLSPPTVFHLIQKYEDWKREVGRFDFEDLLLMGQVLKPPVKVVLADECQDNSPLLWSVVNSWGNQPTVASFICAGDAWQALYSFAGGDPSLFSDREGAWQVIKQTHRFNNESADYARKILRPVFGRDTNFELLSDWEGVGPTGEDPSQFWLARTNALVQAKAAQLQDAGVPYLSMRGRSPLQSKAAEAYKAILRTEEGNMLSKEDLLNISGEAPNKAASERFIRSLPHGYYGFGTLTAATGLSPQAIKAQLRNVDYFSRIVHRFGADGILKQPNLRIGTIHSAKGKEAGSVVVCSNWATRPARDLASYGGRRAEACAAYVASSRHKYSLRFDPMSDERGGPYPFPR